LGTGFPAKLCLASNQGSVERREALRFPALRGFSGFAGDPSVHEHLSGKNSRKNFLFRQEIFLFAENAPGNPGVGKILPQLPE
jgi:hypothetical protein